MQLPLHLDFFMKNGEVVLIFQFSTHFQTTFVTYFLVYCHTQRYSQIFKTILAYFLHFVRMNVLIKAFFTEIEVSFAFFILTMMPIALNRIDFAQIAAISDMNRGFLLVFLYQIIEESFRVLAIKSVFFSQ